MNHLLKLIVTLAVLCGAAFAQAPDVTAPDDTLVGPNPGWSECDLGNIPPCNPGGSGIPVSPFQTINNASPSLDGASMQFGFTSPAGGNTNVLWVYKYPANDAANVFATDFWVYPASNCAQVQQFEFDTWQSSVTTQKEHMFGMQCNRTNGKWDIWNQLSGNWIPTSVPCQMSCASWNHIQQNFHRVTGDTGECSGQPCMYFDSLTFNDTKYRINRSQPSGALPGGWGSNVGIQWQLNIPGANITSAENLDSVQFSQTVGFPPQLWDPIISNSRAIDWSGAGAGTIPTRTCTQNLTSTATQVQINAAIVSAAPNTAVCLGAGTYNLTDFLFFNNKSNVTLRGAGSNQTFLNYSAATTIGAIYAANSNTNNSGAPGNIANWTAGYTQGAETITLSNTTNLQVGSLIILDQQNDASDPGNIWVCDNPTCATGSAGDVIGRSGRAQMQQVTVTSITGSLVGISPGLYAPNWRSGQTPGAWWSTAPPATGIGIEDLSIDTSLSNASFNANIFFHNIANSWIARVRSINRVGSGAAKKHVQLYQSSHNTVRDSYFYGSAGASESYGVDSSYGSADNLIENNICHHVATCWIREGDTGTVFAHGYAADNFYTASGSNPQWQMGDSFHHGPGESYGLWEGNIGSEFELDDIHGTSFMMTAFRNYWTGFDPGGGGAKTQQTIAAQIYAGSRYVNLIGNVLGKAGYHTVYSCVAAAVGTGCADGNHSIIVAGFSGDSGSHGAFNNDLLVGNSLFRWGNYDTVNNAARFVSGEVPSGLSLYANSVPATQTIPCSFYMSSCTRPTWWKASIPFPAIGVGVTSGTGPGNLTNLNPAGDYYINVLGGKTDGTSGPLPFDANAAYYGAPVGQTIYRPTAFTDSGTAPTSNPTLAYDGDPSTFASGVSTNTTAYTVVYRGFPALVGPLANAVVYVVSDAYNAAAGLGGTQAEYSLNGGSTWNQIWVGPTYGSQNTPKTDRISLPIGQDFTQVQVRFGQVSNCSPPGCTITGQEYEVWIQTTESKSQIQGTVQGTVQ